jgi:mRNA interferase RelE/StbE
MMQNRKKVNSLSSFRIFETDEFQKKSKKINKKDQDFILKKLTNHIYPQLKEQPYYGPNIKKLVNIKPETWRFRIGTYRIFYIIDDVKKVVYILSIEKRKNIYQ